MPPKRKSTGPTAKSTQSTLAFHGSTNKVTKPGTRASNAKKNLLEEPTSKDEKPDVVEVQVKDQEEEPTNAEAAIIEQTKQVQQETESTPQEVEARQITKQTLEAWLKKQDAGNAPRVHQEDLSLHEKILRKFDMSGQYGVSAHASDADRSPALTIDMLTGSLLVAVYWNRSTEALAARAPPRPRTAHRSTRCAAKGARWKGQIDGAKVSD